MTLELSYRIDRWEMRTPFVTAKETLHHIETLTVQLERNGLRGRGEALGVDYLGETAHSIASAIESVREVIRTGISAQDLQQLLPAGGARNALDCALWDLTAKEHGRRVWELLELKVAPVTSVVTIALGETAAMVAQARHHRACPVLKLKLDEHNVAGKLTSIRQARPDATIVIDANESWRIETLDSVAHSLLANRVAMLEQPLPRDRDAALEDLDYPVPLCADESSQSMAELTQIANRYTMINIKLDKCGGLTEALAMLEWCRNNDKQAMVGNMLGSSLAMAPGFIVAQDCAFVDLDGPLLQCHDRANPIRYDGGLMHAPDARLWG